MIALGLAAYARPAAAQFHDLQASVEYIAGQNIYLSVGSESGIQRRDTIDVFRAEEKLGRLRVISVTTRRAVTTFVGGQFPVTFGDNLTLKVKDNGSSVSPTVVSNSPAAAEARAERSSIMSAGPASRSSSNTNRVRVRGRVSLETQSLLTTTVARVDTLDRIRTSFASTNASLRSTIDNLPGGMKANLHFRAAYRRSSAVTTLSPKSIRVYKASIEKRFKSQPLSFEIGRFYSLYEDFSGYWDGAILRYGERNLGAGFAVGFEPTLSNEGFDSNLPKYSAFADFETRGPHFRYDADVSFHEVMGQNQYSKHDYVGVQHGIRSRRLRLDQDVQVNHDPESSSWIVTRFQTTASAQVVGTLRLNGRYLLRRPYYVWRTQNFMSTRRDRINIGANVNVGGGVAGLNVTSNTYEGQKPYTTYSAFLNLTQTRVAGIGFTSAASFWTRNDNRALSANAGLSRRLGPVFLRGRYRYYQTELGAERLTTHAFNSSVDFRLPERISLTVQVQYQFGDTFENTSVFTGLWKSF